MQKLIVAALVVAISFILPPAILAHCDSYSGPVIIAAMVALENGDVTPLLKWIPQKDEEIIKTAFAKTLKVRVKGPESKELADTYFFETLVRIHRESEGASFTGLKKEAPAPITQLSDKALETGTLDSLANKIKAHLSHGLIERYNKVLELRKNADKSVAAGREYVEAYVEFIHYVEGLHRAISSNVNHMDKESTPEKKNVQCK